MLENRIDSDFEKIFTSSLISACIYISIIFILGSSPIFQSLVTIMPLIKGLGIGILISYIYLEYRLSGVFYVVTTIIPVSGLIVFSIILSSREAMKFGYSIYKSVTNLHSFSVNIKTYLLKFLIISIIVLIASLLDAGLNTLFFNFFSLG